MVKKYLDKELVKSFYKPRLADSHKGTYGHGLLMAGSKGMMGAAVISSRACLRTGIGLLTTLVPSTERTILQQTIPEAMLTLKFPTTKKLLEFDAIGAGPGIGADKSAEAQIEKIIKVAPKKLLLDADALNILAANKKLLSALPTHTILTPHIKEFDRIFGTHTSEEKRVASAVKQAQELNIIIVLKNAITIITDGKNIIYNDNQNAGLAKGGSGDTLTGIILAFLSQGYEPLQAAGMGVFIHTKAAALCLQSQSVESMLATDVIENIGAAFLSIHK